MSTGEKEVFDRLAGLQNSKTVILGIGNTLKGDDGAGCIVCQRLSGKINAELINAGTVPENYIQVIIKKKPQALVVIDAVDFKAKPGTIKVFRPQQLDSFIISTHTLSPRIFTDMICSNIEVDVYFIGIQPARIELTEQISEYVERAIDFLGEILTEIFSKERKIR